MPLVVTTWALLPFYWKSRPRQHMFVTPDGHCQTGSQRWFTIISLCVCRRESHAEALQQKSADQMSMMYIQTVEAELRKFRCVKTCWKTCLHQFMSTYKSIDIKSADINWFWVALQLTLCKICWHQLISTCDCYDINLQVPTCTIACCLYSNFHSVGEFADISDVSLYSIDTMQKLLTSTDLNVQFC